MLISGPFIAINSNALVHNIAIPIKALTKGLHHQLLEVAAKNLESIAIGENHHVATTFPVSCHIPRRCHQSGRIPAAIGHSRGFIHLSRTGQEFSDIGTNECPRQQSHGTGDACATTHPIEHVEAFEPGFLLGLLIKPAVQHRDRYRLASPLTSVGLQLQAGLLHADVRLGCSTGLAHRHHQCGLEASG